MKMKEKMICTLWRDLPIICEKHVSPKSQHFIHMPAGHDFQKRGHLHLLYRLTGFDFSYTQLILFPPSASQWLHPFLHLSGHSPTSQAPMSFELRCSPSHITGPIMRQKAAEGLSKLQPVAILLFRYGLEFSSFSIPCLPLHDLLLLSHWWLLGRCRYVSQPLTPLGDEKFEIELVSEANSATQKPEKRVFLSWIWIEMIFMLKLLLPFSFYQETTSVLQRFVY